jgi:hypothetical protein
MRSWRRQSDFRFWPLRGRFRDDRNPSAHGSQADMPAIAKISSNLRLLNLERRRARNFRRAIFSTLPRPEEIPRRLVAPLLARQPRPE